MSENNALNVLQRVGAFQEGHFQYASGEHGRVYVNKDALYARTMETSHLCRAMAKEFVSVRPNVIVGPAVGGVVLAQWTAYHLTVLTGREVFAVYADKSDDGRGYVIKRGYDQIVNGQRVLVVEDILNSGASAAKTVDAVRTAGGTVIGLGALCSRRDVVLKDVGDVPITVALSSVELESWDPADCPLCEAGVAIDTTLGKGWRLS